jgi:DNA-binding HxlR family transcriptional regulator
MPRRSYDQFCAIAWALDVVGDRWTLLIVRELLAGARRYSDLHADLPGVSTDVLASRLKDLERDGLVTRRRLPPPGAASVYELTPAGRRLLPVLTALATFGAPGLAERQPTDAVRAHWFALPLLDRVARLAAGRTGVVDVALAEGSFHIRLGDGPDGGAAYGDGPAADPAADVRLTVDAATCVALAQDAVSFPEGIADGRITLAGEGDLADALRGK